MKICPNCNNQSDDNARFCNNCGCVYPEQAVQQPLYDASAQPQYDPYQPPVYQAAPPVDNASGKKINVPVLIILIVVGILILGGGVYAALDGFDLISVDLFSFTGDDGEDEEKDEDEGKDEDEDTQTAPADETTTVAEEETTAEDELSKLGTISGNKYVNEWFDISISVPAGFSARDRNIPDKCEDKYVYMSDDKTDALTFKICDYSVYNGKDLAEIVSSTINHWLGDSEAISITEPYEYKISGDKFIKGKAYKNTDAGVGFIAFSVCEKDGYYVVVSLEIVEATDKDVVAVYDQMKASIS